MSHKNKNMIDQTIKELISMCAFGDSRHKDKRKKVTKEKIYSYSTFESYKRHCCDFAKYCQKNHKCKTLASSRLYVDEYLKRKMDAGYSPSTIKLIASALGKLFHEPTTNFIKTPSRNRDIIKRSRHIVLRDKHFSIKNNKDLIVFCECTGLRRRELENLKGDCLVKKGNDYYIKVENGKGGKYRLAPIIDNNKYVLDKMQSVGSNERVWGKVHNGCDVHGYRSVYANCLYRKYARDIQSIPYKERYYCRKDMKGVVLDKKAMKLVSKALGHNRIEVFAYSYYRK